MKLALQLLLALTLLLPGVCPAADRDEPAIYVIKQGDSLWGLSERFIKDPNYWPDMWSKNSQITNPHLIYPGQKVRIFPDRLELVPREESIRKDAAPGPLSAPARQLAETAAERTYAILGSEGFILENGTKPAGTIIGIHSNRNIAGDDDIVYTDIGRELGVIKG